MDQNRNLTEVKSSTYISVKAVECMDMHKEIVIRYQEAKYNTYKSANTQVSAKSSINVMKKKIKNRREVEMLYQNGRKRG